MAKLPCHLLMKKVNHVIVANIYVANMSFNAIREIKILAKISDFTVTPHKLKLKFIKVKIFLPLEVSNVEI